MSDIHLPDDGGVAREPVGGERPADVPTPSRGRRAVAGGAAQIAAQAANLLRGFISVPLLLHYLGQERYGLWLTIAGTFMLLLFADLGVGGGLSTLLSQATGRKDRSAERRLVSSAFYLLVLLAAGFLVLDVAVLRRLPLYRFFNVSYAGAERDTLVLATGMVAIYALNLPLQLNQRIYLAYQESYWSAAWTVVGAVVSLAGMLVAIWARAGLGWLLAAVLGTPVVVSAVAMGVLFFVQKRWLVPVPRRIHTGQLKLLLSMGSGFLFIEILKIAYYHSDNLIITYRCGVGEVVPYAVPARLFLLATTAFQAAVLPMWGAFGEAKGSNDWHWIRRATGRLLLVTLVGVGGLCLLLVPIGPWFVRFWTGGEVYPAYGFVFLLAILAVSNAMSNSLYICLNGLGLVKQQVPLFLLVVAAKVGLAWVLAPKMGTIGVAVASLVAVDLTLVPGSVYLLYRRLARMERAAHAAARN